MSSATRLASGDGRHVFVVAQDMPLPLDRRVWLQCESLVADGFRVSAVCPKASGEQAFEVLAGVRLHRYAPLPLPSRVARSAVGHLLAALWSWLRSALVVWRTHRRDPIAVLQAGNPQDTAWLIAWPLRRSGTKFLFDHHDLCPELYRSTGRRSFALVERGLEWLERRTYRAADAVITTNESYRRIACGRTGRHVRDVTVVRSGPDPDRMRRAVARPQLRDGHDHLVSFLGRMGPRDGVDVIVRAAHHIVHVEGRTDIGFALLGYGESLEELRELAVELDVADHVQFVGRVELDAITAWLSTTAVGISPDPSTPFNDVSTMSRTLEYMAYELPVVAFYLPETVVSAGGAAVYVHPTSERQADVAMAQTLIDLVDDPARRQLMGRIGRIRIDEHLGWPESAPRYLRVVRALVTPFRDESGVPQVTFRLNPQTQTERGTEPTADRGWAAATGA